MIIQIISVTLETFPKKLRILLGKVSLFNYW